MNTITDINNNAATFDNQVGSTSLYVKALLQSSSTSGCELDTVGITGNSAY